MKTIHLFVSLLFVITISFAQETENDKPIFEFVTETIDYGKIGMGTDGKRVFEFTNTGKTPLIITRVQASCGCTVPKKPENPIMPGDKGKIEVSYDTKRLGGFSKIITIFSNANNERKTIKIKGYVEKDIAPEKKRSILSEEN